jgi:hypothetical protein
MPETVYAAGEDIGTMWIQTARDDGKGGITYNSTRDAYCEMPHDDEMESVLKEQGIHFIKEGQKIYVLGEDAYRQCSMAEFTLKADDDILKRPMKSGVINPSSPKTAVTILRELMRACLERGVGQARPGEILYFSVPANPVDSPIDSTFHESMAKQFLQGLGYDARPLGEGAAVIYAENPLMHLPDGTTVPLTGLGVSLGAGQQNFCLAQRGKAIDEFSVARSGDWIDDRVAVVTGEPKTKVLRMKENKLDFNNLDLDDPIILALDSYYEALVKYSFGKFAERFANKRGSLDGSIDMVLSGGTASVPGFDKKVKAVLSNMDLPFKIHEVRLAGGGDRMKMLKAVVKGCYVRAVQAAKKANAESEKK